MEMDAITSIVGLVAVLAPAAWGLARLVASDGSNGTFLRANPDLGWPRGVQEDDDVKWRWDRPQVTAPVRQPVTVAIGLARPPVVPLEAAPLRLAAPALPARPNPEPDAEIVETGVTAVRVTRVRRGR